MVEDVVIALAEDLLAEEEAAEEEEDKKTCFIHVFLYVIIYSNYNRIRSIKYEM